MKSDKPILLIIGGPTAAGKTQLAIELAEHFRTEIISFDSRQFFREMSIGTAVPNARELGLVPHHFIQHRTVAEPYSAGAYANDALPRLKELFNDHPLVVAVGGSGLYIDALVWGFDEFPDVDDKLRKQLRQRLEEEGLESLVNELQSCDPVSYSRIDLRNPRRVLRVLEVSIQSGRPYSSFLGQKKDELFFKPLTFVLSPARKELYDRIDKRVLRMIDAGLLEEARGLLPLRHYNALNTVGYKELFRYFDGEYSLEQAIAEIQKNTRRFAKRQITWFKKSPGLTLLQTADAEIIIKSMSS